jgi:hypothetical protein
MVNRLLPYCSPDDIFELLQAASADCGRNTDSDILGAISAVKRQKYRGGTNSGLSNFTRKETGQTQKEAVQKDYPRVIALYRKHGDYNRLLRYCGTTPELRATRTLDWLYDLYRPEDILGPRGR